MDVGPAYYEDPVSSNPTYTKGIKAPLDGWNYEAYLNFIFDSKGKGLSGAQERTHVFPLLIGGPVVPMPPRFPVLFF